MRDDNIKIKINETGWKICELDNLTQAIGGLFGNICPEVCVS
jgi:hypothetical protein